MDTSMSGIGTYPARQTRRARTEVRLHPAWYYGERPLSPIMATIALVMTLAQAGSLVVLAVAILALAHAITVAFG